MPRKTDGIEFEIHPRPTKGEDGKPLLYVRPAKGRKKSFKQRGRGKFLCLAKYHR